MLKSLFTVLPLVLFSHAALAVSQVFTVDLPRSEMTLQNLKFDALPDAPPPAPVTVKLDGEFAIDVGIPTEGANVTDPKNWNVTAKLIQDTTIAPISVELPSPIMLDAVDPNGGGTISMIIDTFIITGFSVSNTPVPATLTGGPPVSTGSETTNAEFLAAGSIDLSSGLSLQIENVPNLTEPANFNIELADANQLGFANGNLGTHITATTTIILKSSSNNARLGSIEGVLNLYGYSNYTGTVNPAPTTGGGGTSGGSSSSSSGGAADWLMLLGLTAALLGIRRRNKLA